jgi:hypothetical protein
MNTLLEFLETNPEFDLKVQFKPFPSTVLKEFYPESSTFHLSSCFGMMRCLGMMRQSPAIAILRVVLSLSG